MPIILCNCPPPALPDGTADGQIPVWDEAAGAWVAQTPTDPDCCPPDGGATGGILVWDGSQWITQNPIQYDWTALTLEAGWSGTMYVKRYENICHMALSINRNTGAGSTIVVLPPWAIPQTHVQIAAPQQHNGSWTSNYTAVIFISSTFETVSLLAGTDERIISTITYIGKVI